MSMPFAISRTGELLDAVRSLYASIERFDAHVAEELNVDRSSQRAINAMEHGPISPGALGETLGLSSGSVTALLTRLEDAGHIERFPIANDGRRRDAALTVKTRKRAQRHYERLGKTISGTFISLDSDSLHQTIVTICALARCFDAEHG